MKKIYKDNKYYKIMKFNWKEKQKNLKKSFLIKNKYYLK